MSTPAIVSTLVHDCRVAGEYPQCRLAPKAIELRRLASLGFAARIVG